MSRRRRRILSDEKAEMTPLIDVTFLLLIFFLVTLQFRTLEGRLDSTLPKDRGGPPLEAEEIEKVDIRIDVGRKGELVPDPATGGHHLHYVDRVLIYRVGVHRFNDLPGLRSFLAGLDPAEQPVTIDARAGVVYGDALAVLDLLTELEFAEVAFAGSYEEE